MPVLPPSLLRWTAADFTQVDQEGVYADPTSGARLLPGAPEGVLVGERTSLPVEFMEAIASWQATAPAGTELEIALRVEIEGRWTRWWTMAYWSSEQTRRRSLENQDDDDGVVATDTLVLRRPARALQWRVVLRGDTTGRSPLLRGLAVMATPAGIRPRHDRPHAVSPLPVPEISQMEIATYGHLWCSPAALTMVLQYWYRRTRDPQLEPFLAPDATERLTVPGVYDPVYDGTGNWPFNTAFAASLGLEAYVVRFVSLAEVARWVAAAVPVIVSIAWEGGDLDDAPCPRSSGHLTVVVGFTPDGDVIVNEPRADTRDGAKVRRVYPRDQFHRAWFRRSGGVTYLIYPKGIV